MAESYSGAEYVWHHTTYVLAPGEWETDCNIVLLFWAQVMDQHYDYENVRAQCPLIILALLQPLPAAPIWPA